MLTEKSGGTRVVEVCSSIMAGPCKLKSLSSVSRINTGVWISFISGVGLGGISEGFAYRRVASWSLESLGFEILVVCLAVHV